MLHVSLLTSMGDQREKFSLQYQYNIKQISNEKEQKHQVGDY